MILPFVLLRQIPHLIQHIFNKYPVVGSLISTWCDHTLLRFVASLICKLGADQLAVWDDGGVFK